MNNNRYCIIMAGGIGSRFWPVSRRQKPKQFLEIMGTGKSFLRHTYERFAETIPAENFIISTNSIYKDQVLEHLPELSTDQVLCEPVGRNTAPCIAFAVWHLRAKNPEATMIITPSDHLILNESKFRDTIGEAADFAENHKALMTIGITPTGPETGYGYIQRDTTTPTDNGHINRIKLFTEKPKLEMAQIFVDSGEFSWNSGIFIWTVPTIMESLNEFLPETQEIFSSIENDFGTPNEAHAIARVYPECRNISIDYGVMEKAANAYVLCSDFGWSDVGTWGSIYQHLPKDKNEDFCLGDVVTYDTHGCVITGSPDKLIIVDSMEGYLIIDTQDVLLICPRSKEQNIKSIVEEVKFRFGEKFV